MSQDEELELVKVFQSHDLGQFVLAKAYLDSIVIPYIDKNEGLQILTGVDVGPMEIWVSSKDALKALEVLRDMENGK